MSQRDPMRVQETSPVSPQSVDASAGGAEPPRRLSRYCALWWCERPAEGGSTRCREHRLGAQRVEQAEPQRQADHRFYQSTRWRRLRRVVLRHPFNAVCRVEGCGELSTQVDHIIPRHVWPEGAFARTNLQGLCARHHSEKTRAEQRGARWASRLRPRPPDAAGRRG